MLPWLTLAAPLALASPASPAWITTSPPGTPSAVLERDGAILVGTDGGLYRWGSDGWSLVLTRGGVGALAAGARDGATFIATPRGLYEWTSSARAPRAVPLGAGARVRSVAVDAGGAVWVATEVGLFVRSDSGVRPVRLGGFRREASLPAGDVLAVRTAGSDVWASMRGALWVGRDGAPFEKRLAGLPDGWWELRGAEPVEGSTLLAVPSGLWRVVGARAERVRPGLGELRDLARVASGLWLATERGLFPLRPDALETAPGRAAVDAETMAVRPAANGLLVATRRGIARIVARTSSGEVLPFRRMSREPAAEPGILALQRAVIEHQGLEPHRISSLESAAEWAPLWPEVRAAFSVDRDRGRDQDRDQSFTSGALHDLFDSATDRRSSYELSLQLVWDLDQLREPARALSVSRERRELVELRDQVLERVNRLYFERQRLLAQLAAGSAEPAEPSDGGAASRADLLIRAREIAAQLDAWSGGTFTRLVEASPPANGRSE